MGKGRRGGEEEEEERGRVKRGGRIKGRERERAKSGRCGLILHWNVFHLYASCLDQMYASGWKLKSLYMGSEERGGGVVVMNIHATC